MNTQPPIPYRPLPQRPANRPARRAGILTLVLGAVGGFMSIILILAVLFLPALEKSPEAAASIDELRRQLPGDLNTLLVISAVVFVIYAIAAITIGIGLIGGRRGWVIAGLTFSIGCVLFMVLNTLSAIATGNGGLFPLMLVALHGLAAYWLLAALRPEHAAAVQPARRAYQPMPPNPVPHESQVFVPPAVRQPMDDYYVPLPRRD